MANLMAWDVATAQEVFGQKSMDDLIFAYAAEHRHGLVTTERACLAIGSRSPRELRPVPNELLAAGPHRNTRVERVLALNGANPCSEAMIRRRRRRQGRSDNRINRLADCPIQVLEIFLLEPARLTVARSDAQRTHVTQDVFDVRLGGAVLLKLDRDGLEMSR